ncbi:MAG TPA: hypothetical protein VN976_22890 [Verrucomicrobiae bacterium]|nr:hypothetical protein [Verrucomicrobiae bacterium]
MERLPLTLAISEHGYVADVTNGRLTGEGIDLTCLVMEIEEIFFRFLNYREFDLSEI